MDADYKSLTEYTPLALLGEEFIKPYARDKITRLTRFDTVGDVVRHIILGPGYLRRGGIGAGTSDQARALAKGFIEAHPEFLTKVEAERRVIGLVTGYTLQIANGVAEYFAGHKKAAAKPANAKLLSEATFYRQFTVGSKVLSYHTQAASKMIAGIFAKRKKYAERAPHLISLCELYNAAITQLQMEGIPEVKVTSSVPEAVLPKEKAKE